MGQPLPVIVSLGGVNSAGRSSMHHACARLLHSALPAAHRAQTLAALRQLTGATAVDEEHLLAGTLIRRIEDAHFDPLRVPWNQRLPVDGGDEPLRFSLRRRYLRGPLPSGWHLIDDGAPEHVSVEVRDRQELLLPAEREFEVKVASQLPTGFDPAALYPSRNHPRGLAMAVYAASDALGYLGMNWDQLLSQLAPEQVSVYAGSAMGQLDDNGTGGMLKARYRGGRVTSKNCPLGLAEMPADFINAYVLGTAGATGATLGACASFLYNLRLAVQDIRAGRARVAVVGAAEAPITPEIMEGYATMGALATDRALRQLDGLSDSEIPDYRRACRPFGENCGFTVAESAQAIILFDDRLALETGASILGSAADVFVNADGYKKSISGPGVGNYLTVARAAAAARAIVGDGALRRGGVVQARGTGTPQNRVTESIILDRVAGAFGIEGWAVAAIKGYLGHSLGAASGDQLTAQLGCWALGHVPGIGTTRELAADVSADNLDFCLQHRELDAQEQAYALINSKGFGGNNATATLLSPTQTLRMLRARHGRAAIDAWRQREEVVQQRRAEREQRVLAGQESPRYRFDYQVLGDSEVEFDGDRLRIGGVCADLNLSSPFPDMHGDA
jgi:acetoacetyl-[acyl-carrier protein] synthase